MNDLHEIDRMTYREYRIRMKAYRLRRVDRDYDIAMMAWMNREIKAEKRSGKNIRPVYTSFSQFFDYEKAERRALGIKEEESPQITRYKQFLRLKNGGL